MNWFVHGNDSLGSQKLYHGGDGKRRDFSETTGKGRGNIEEEGRQRKSSRKGKTGGGCGRDVVVFFLSDRFLRWYTPH